MFKNENCGLVDQYDAPVIIWFFKYYMNPIIRKVVGLKFEKNMLI